MGLFKLSLQQGLIRGGGGGEARGETRPGTEKQCSHNLQSDPLGSGFKKGRENFPVIGPASTARVQC